MCDLGLRETVYAKWGWTSYTITESVARCWSCLSGLSYSSLILNWIQYIKRGMIEGKKKSKLDTLLDSSISLLPQFIHVYSNAIVKHAESVNRHLPLKGLPLPSRNSSLRLFSYPHCCLQLPPPVAQQSQVWALPLSTTQCPAVGLAVGLKWAPCQSES